MNLDEFFFDSDQNLIITSKGQAKRLNIHANYPLSNIYDDVIPNPRIEEIYCIHRLFSQKQIKTIIAIGGGSVIDIAKIISLVLNIEENLIQNVVTGIEKTKQRNQRLILIPTVFGSGAEQTPFAVCYLNAIKYSVVSKFMMADTVHYNWLFSKTLSIENKIASVIDCFAQAFESYTSNNATNESKEYSVLAISLCTSFAKNYVESNNQQSALGIMLASKYSGKAIAIAKTTGAHALSYYLTIQHEIKHGLAVGICLLIFINIYMAEEDTVGNVDILKSLFQSEDNPYNEVNNFFKSLGFNTKEISKRILNEVDLNEWASQINLERLKNGPKIDTNKISSGFLVSYLNQLYNDE
jgi:alcohol dehydrogenase class IV